MLTSSHREANIVFTNFLFFSFFWNPEIVTKRRGYKKERPGCQRLKYEALSYGTRNKMVRFGTLAGLRMKET